MYSIYADELCIYDDLCTLEDIILSEPKLTLEDNNAGSLTFVLPPSNIGYEVVKRLTTKIFVKKNGDEYWEGRVINETVDFWNCRHIVCEGSLAYLNDSLQPPAEYHNQTVRSFLETLISIHNSKVSQDKQFTVGVVTVTDPNDSLYRYTNYEKTIECINDKLINRLGGHLRIRKVNGVRYLDYLSDYPETSGQEIEFGSNLIDFTKHFNVEDYATVIVPTGARLDESPIEALDAYLTVESVNGGSIYVRSEEAIASYGWIVKRVSWDDVTNASILLTKAQRYLSDLQFDNVQLELTAFDLSYLNPSIDSMELLDTIRVYSMPHGMDRMFPVNKITINLDSPESTTYTLGTNIKTSLTSVNNSINNAIKESIDNLPKAHAILDQAKDNATALINTAVKGYITIEHNANGSQTLYITDTQDPARAIKMWKWNLNGLGYSNDGGKTFGTAITMDGAIVADFITAGTMLADRIKGGVLTLGGLNNQNGLMEVYDSSNRKIISINNEKIIYDDPSNNRFAGLTDATFGIGGDDFETGERTPIAAFCLHVDSNNRWSESFIRAYKGASCFGLAFDDRTTGVPEVWYRLLPKNDSATYDYRHKFWGRVKFNSSIIASTTYSNYVKIGSNPESITNNSRLYVDGTATVIGNVTAKKIGITNAGTDVYTNYMLGVEGDSYIAGLLRVNSDVIGTNIRSRFLRLSNDQSEVSPNDRLHVDGNSKITGKLAVGDTMTGVKLGLTSSGTSSYTNYMLGVEGDGYIGGNFKVQNKLSCNEIECTNPPWGDLDPDFGDQSITCGGLTAGWGTISTEYVVAAGDHMQAPYFEQTSARKFKKNIKSMTEDEANKLLELNPVSFDFKDENKGGNDHRGFIVDEVNPILPNLVGDSEESLNYVELIPYLVKKIQMMDKEIKELQNEVERLKKG